LEGGQGAFEFGIAAGCGGFEVFAGGEGRGSRGINERVGCARIGEEEDGELEAGLLLLEPGVGEVAVTLLLLQVGFDYIGVGCFAGVFALLGELGEAGGFVGGALSCGEFMVCGEGAVIEADYGGDEAATGDFEFGGGYGGSG
jgi:hypothetical protein